MRNENVCPHTDLYLNVLSTFSHDSQNLETIKCPSVGEWIKKLWDSHTVEYHSAVKAMNYHPCNNMNEYQDRYAE